MINLLPPQTRQDFLYARRNTKLLRWSMALLAGMAGIVIVVVFGYFYIDQNTRNIGHQVDQARAELQAQELEKTQQRVQDISGSLKLTTGVLSRQVLFSEVLKQAGSVMPVGSALSGLSLSKLQGGIDLQAVTKDYQTATQVQLNLQDPNNKIFEKVDIINIACGTSDQDDRYPCNASYRASFAKNNPFLLLSSPASGGTP